MMYKHGLLMFAFVLMGLPTFSNVQAQVEFSIQATDFFGNSIDAVKQNQMFWLEVSVEDVRANPQGVFGAFVDIDTPGVLRLMTSPSADFPTLLLSASSQGPTSVGGFSAGPSTATGERVVCRVLCVSFAPTKFFFETSTVTQPGFNASVFSASGAPFTATNQSFQDQEFHIVNPATIPPPLPAPFGGPAQNTAVFGDLDFDGRVNSRDLGLMLNNFGAAIQLNWSQGDLDCNPGVDSIDLGRLLNNWTG